MIRFINTLILIFITFVNFSSAEIIEKIDVKGNERISKETIIMFSSVELNDEIDDIKLNDILKNIYNSNFFDDVSITFIDKILTISVKENPIIENIEITGIKSNSLKDQILQTVSLKSRSSYNEILLNNDIFKISNFLKSIGYFFSKIDVVKNDLLDNKVDVTIQIDLGNKAKIKKISFLGNKIFKDKKLKSVIVSEEYKFWKFISGKKYLNENVINLDTRLLRNFYLNEGYYNVEINSSFAKMINEEEFELVFNINAKQIVYINKVNLNLPEDYNKQNFNSVFLKINEIVNKPYSISEMETIIEQIELLALSDQYESINVNIDENLIDDQLTLNFNITETEKYFVEKINIFGNNITNENVIRNNFLIDEGDPFNEILFSKSINEIKRLNFFKEVKSEILEDQNNNTKIINISVEEKATGEISAGAGFGTSGGTLAFGIKENNFLGNGISLNTSLDLSANSIKGQFAVTHPNYKNSDKSLYYNIQALELDRLTNFGYKSNKIGFNVGTNFEYLDDLDLGLGIENYLEKIETDSTASDRQKSQSGNYLDTFLNVDVKYDKRNQRYQTTSGFYNLYTVKLPLLSESSTLTNEYSYKYFTELYKNNVTSALITLSTANSLNNKQIKLSERLFIPSRNLRGFEAGKIGPKDGNDYVGGNYMTSLNIVSTLPQFLENSQNFDFLIFLDTANLWGIDYDKTLNDNSSFRSAIGIGFDWLTPIGPLNFSFAQPITKAATDVTETFRFNLGTTF